jgi:hypothetical protein
MMKSIKSTTLEAAMRLSWALIRSGERVVEFSERMGANDLRAGLAELLILKAGRAIMFVGERLELGANWVAMALGYVDGELSGAVAWPAQSR